MTQLHRYHKLKSFIVDVEDILRQGSYFSNTLSRLNTMVVDDLVTQGAIAAAAMVLITEQFPWNIPLSEPPGGRLNKKDGLTRYGDSHVKDKTS